MFGQLCEGAVLGVAVGGEVAAVVADPALTADAVMPPDVGEVACAVAALAIATLAPNAAPSAPAPAAAPMMILPSVVFNVSAS